MSFNKICLVPMVSVFALGACSFASDTFFPPVDDDENVVVKEEKVTVIKAAPVQGQVQQSNVAYGVDGDAAGNYITFKPQAPLKTVPGEKVAQLRGELYQLHNTINRHSDNLAGMRHRIAVDAGRYHENVAFINSRLQVGTTPNNPIMLDKWNEAMRALENVNQDIIGLGQLASQVTADSAMTSYILDSIRATYTLSGAVDEDHQNLRRLEDETNQAAILIERLSKEINNDIVRQQQYVVGERKNMNTLSMAIRDGQIYGAGLSPEPSIAASRAARIENKGDVGSLPKAKIDGRRPLMTIRFDRPNVAYEQPLYQVAKKALEKNPAVVFDIIAVTPDNGMAAGVYDSRRYAEKVSASLVSMGIPARRINLAAMSSAKATSGEVMVFVK